LKLKIDENLGTRTADVFRAAGHDVATVAEQSLQAADDAEIFAVCAREQRALVTLDLDFANPLRFAPAASAGIAVLRVPDLPSGRDLVAAAMRLVSAMQADDIVGCLWVVGVTRVRKHTPHDLA
jgi:predicted nuclease of predicted toxin-antitoxin system